MGVRGRRWVNVVINGGILMVLELFSIFTVVVDIQTYMYKKICIELNVCTNEYK